MSVYSFEDVLNIAWWWPCKVETSSHIDVLQKLCLMDICFFLSNTTHNGMYNFKMILNLLISWIIINCWGQDKYCVCFVIHSFYGCGHDLRFSDYMYLYVYIISNTVAFFDLAHVGLGRCCIIRRYCYWWSLGHDQNTDMLGW